MTDRLVALSCLLLLTACTETGDSAFTYEETDTVAPDTSSGVYWEHIEPILGRTCVGCHTASKLGGTNFASTYEDNLKPSYFCSGMMIGECLSVRMDGATMPPGGGAGGMLDEERDLLDEWVAAGMPFAAGGASPTDADAGPEDTAEDVEEDALDVGPVDVLTDAADADVTDTATDTATDTETDTATDTATDAGDAATDAGDAGDGDAGSGDAIVEDTVEPPVPTWTDDVQPILTVYCSACHGDFGGWSTANYTDTQKDSYHCAGLTKGECFSVRIKGETMPTAAGGGSILDEVVASGDLEIIDAWIAGGMLQ
jgi:hypothetical protein